jgi:hypothetical protein
MQYKYTKLQNSIYHTSQSVQPGWFKKRICRRLQDFGNVAEIMSNTEGEDGKTSELDAL